MGLYDYLNGEQVKCFYRVVYDKEDGVTSFHKSGGYLRGYITGDDLPLKTFHYKYPANFLILDYEGILHTIKDGKLHNTQFVHDIKYIDSELLNHVYGYNGEELNIANIDDLKIFPSKFEERQYEIVRMQKEYKPSSYRLVKSFHARVVNSSNCEKIIDILESEDYNDFNAFLRTLDTSFLIDIKDVKKSKELIKSISSNSDYSEKLVTYIQSKAKEIYDTCNDRLPIEKERFDSMVNPYLKSFVSKWYKESDNKLESLIGSYISVIYELEEFKKEYPESFNDRDVESYNNATVELLKLLKENKNGLEQYLEWLKPSDKELKIIENIVHN